jgi:hypothetical protein
MFLAVWTAHEVSQHSNFGGIMLLYWVAWADFILILLLGVSAFSAVITEEKELMSLGLLRLAGFTPGSILLGKSVGLLVNALLLLVVQVPFCMLAVTLGGVSIEQVGAVFTLLLAFLVFVYGIAMFASVICKRNSSASRLTALLLIAYHIMPPFLAFLAAELFGSNSSAGLGWFLHEISATSTFWGLANLTSSMGGFGTVSFASHALVNASVGVGMFLWSWLVFDSCNRNETPSAPARSSWIPWRKHTVSRSSQRSWGLALAWKDYRFLSGGTRGLVVRSIIYAVLILIVVLSVSLVGGGGMSPSDLGAFLNVTMAFGFVIELGLASGRVLQTEVKSKTLGALVALPQSLGRTLLSKVMGAAMIAIPSVGFFLLGVLLDPSNLGDFLRHLGDEPGAWYVGTQVVLGLFLSTYYSVRFPRGAFTLALVTIGMGNTIFWTAAAAIMSSVSAVDPLAIFGSLVSLTLCGILAHATVGRVYQLASEE